MKDTGMFRITKYKGPYRYVNPRINQDHSQLDSSFASQYIKTLVKTKRKAMTRLFGD